jgi:hypothetical protein
MTVPAVLIRQLEGLARVCQYTSSEESVPEPSDRAAVRRRHVAVLAAANSA